MWYNCMEGSVEACGRPYTFAVLAALGTHSESSPEKENSFQRCRGSTLAVAGMVAGAHHATPVAVTICFAFAACSIWFKLYVDDTSHAWSINSSAS